VNGVKQAFAITITAPGQIVKITLSKVEFNTPIDDAMFSRPAVK
jgi:outer membrane lipoprotein-sorting protein